MVYIPQVGTTTVAIEIVITTDRVHLELLRACATGMVQERSLLETLTCWPLPIMNLGTEPPSWSFALVSIKSVPSSRLRPDREGTSAFRHEVTSVPLWRGWRC